MARNRRRRLCVALAACLLAVGSATPASATWSSMAVDSQWLFTRPSLDVDGADHTGIAYERLGASPSLEYATNATGGWASATVTSGDVVYPSLDFDSGNRPAIAFSRFDGARGVYVTSNSTGSWGAPTLVSADLDPQKPSLAHNAANKLGVAWTSNYSFSPGLYFATDASGTWVKTKVTSSTWDDGAALKFDGAGKAHILFSRYTPDAPGIYYATNATGTWVVTRVATGLADAVELVLDASGKAHATFRLEGIYYLTNSTGSWSATPLELPSDTFFGAPTIALDDAGVPHVAFSRYRTSLLVPTRGYLAHFFLDNGNWNSQGGVPVDDTARSDELPSLGFLSDGTPQLAYRRSYPSAAIQLFSTGAPTVIAGSHLDGGPSIDLGPSGIRDVSYNRRTGTGGAAYLATSSGSGWSTQKAGDGNPALAGTDIAADGSGGVRIADGSTIYSNGTGSWTAGPSLPEFAETEVEVDGAGKTHLVASYVSLNQPVLWTFQYWTDSSGSWASEDTLGGQDWGLGDDPQPDIALDPAGKPHVVFTAPQGPDGVFGSNLFYQNRVSGSWSAPALVEFGGTRWPAVAVDGAGKVHIAFIGSEAEATEMLPGLWYATNASGSWVTTRLTRSFGEGPPSIALDASGKVYIATTRAAWAAFPGVFVATNTTGAWVVSRVVATSLAIDAQIAVTSTGLARLVYDADTAIMSMDNSTSTLALGPSATKAVKDVLSAQTGVSAQASPAAASDGSSSATAPLPGGGPAGQGTNSIGVDRQR